MQLYTKISIGLIAGAVVGIGVNVLEWTTGVNVVRALEPIGTAFIRAITMIVIPLVVASLIVGVASLGDLRTLGRMGGKTIAYYMCTTAIAVSIGIILSNIIRPGARIAEESKNALMTRTAGRRRGASSSPERHPAS